MKEERRSLEEFNKNYEFSDLDEAFMRRALDEAKKAYEEDEVPIGCVIVKDGLIIGRGHNTVERDKLCLGHAEINAITEASSFIGDWRLDGCIMYSTKEPCAMCAGAIYKARIKKLIFAAGDYKSGCAGSVYNLVADENFNHRVETRTGLLRKEAVELLQRFFRNRRNAVIDNE